MSGATPAIGAPLYEKVSSIVIHQMMAHRLNTAAAFMVALAAVGLVLISDDPTPLLVEPSPDLDWPLGTIGIALGVWSADGICRFRHMPKHLWGRIALWVMVPLMLGYGLVALGNRVQEQMSFQVRGSTEQRLVRVVERSRSKSRLGPAVHRVGVAALGDRHAVHVRVNAATYGMLAPDRDCATVLVERAPDGAERLLRVERWKVPCPY